MDVQVDGGLIRSEREKRAWSQEHLAGAAGIGVRTIQRIETTGSASYESTRALSAALEIPLEQLRSDVRPEPVRGPAETLAGAHGRTRRWRAAASWLGAAVALALVVGIGGFLLLRDYQQVRVLRTFEQWVTEPEPATAQR